MNNSLASQKKRTKGSQQDWHRADIVAALHKRGSHYHSFHAIRDWLQEH